MKKYGKYLLIVFSIGILVFFSGCGVYDEIDLEKTKKDVHALKTTHFDLSKIKEVLDQQEENFGELEDVTEDNLEKYGISKDYIDKENDKLVFVFREEKVEEINTVPQYSYLIVKAAEDKKDLLEEQIEAYYQKLLEEYSQKEDATEEIKEHLKNVMKKEQEGYSIYILSKDNEAVWKLIEESCHSSLFEYTKELSFNDFLQEFSLDEKDILEYQAYLPTDENHASLYVIVKPKKSKVEKVKKQMDQYMKQLEQKWSTYLPEEYILIKNRISTEVGSYFVYIISKDNSAVLDTIKDAAVKKD